MENVKAISERLEGAGRSLSPPSRRNRDPNLSGTSYPMRPIYNCIQFGSRTLWTSGYVVVVGSGLRQSLGSRPRNRPIEKANMHERGDLGG